MGFEVETASFSFVVVHTSADKHYLRCFPPGEKWLVSHDFFHDMEQKGRIDVHIYGDKTPPTILQKRLPYTTIPSIEMIGKAHGQKDCVFIATETFLDPASEQCIMNDAEFVITFPDPITPAPEKVIPHILNNYLDSLHCISDIISSNDNRVYQLQNKRDRKTNETVVFGYDYLVFPRVLNRDGKDKYGFLSAVAPNRMITEYVRPQMTIGVPVQDVYSLLSKMTLSSISPAFDWLANYCIEKVRCFDTLSKERQPFVMNLFILIVYSLQRSSPYRKEISEILVRNSCQNLLSLFTPEEKELVIRCINTIPDDPSLKLIIQQDLSQVCQDQKKLNGSCADDLVAQFNDRVVRRLMDIVSRPLSRRDRNARQFLTDVGLIQQTSNNRVFIELRMFNEWLTNILQLPDDTMMSVHLMMTHIDTYLDKMGYFQE